ncbi:MAG: glutaredoxin [Proteobacteria bacterium]|nr:glutaredoxin [Pseudomonadota bacterium]MCG6935072.1 glutaredoxin [Pseudomonadota bacterium]
MKSIRWILGKIILFLDAVFAPSPRVRSTEAQAEVDARTAQLKLYQYLACPFCVKTRRAIRRLGLQIETRDALHNPEFRKELEEQGGKQQVPCLKITHDDGRVEWMYESSDIIRYLESCFG